MTGQMSSKLDTTCAADQRTDPWMWMPPAVEVEQENVRLRIALRELRHRTCNQWQLLLGLAELERMREPQADTTGSEVRLRAMMQAFVTLNGALDTGTDILMGRQNVSVRAALESILAPLKTASEEDVLSLTLQDAWLPEKACGALMLICAELVCNATKYGRRTTQVTFRVQAEQGVLEVHDAGPGFPAGFRIQDQGGQGLQIVEALCHFDLNGEVRCRNEARGGVVIMTFPIASGSGAATAREATEAFCAMEGIVCF